MDDQGHRPRLVAADLRRFIITARAKDGAPLLASEHPFAAVGGIEFAEAMSGNGMCSAVATNIAQFPRSRMKRRNVECVIDAPSTPGRPTATLVNYFFDLFAGGNLCRRCSRHNIAFGGVLSQAAAPAGLHPCSSVATRSPSDASGALRAPARDPLPREPQDQAVQPLRDRALPDFAQYRPDARPAFILPARGGIKFVVPLRQDSSPCRATRGKSCQRAPDPSSGPSALLRMRGMARRKRNLIVRDPKIARAPLGAPHALKQRSGSASKECAQSSEAVAHAICDGFRQRAPLCPRGRIELHLRSRQPAPGRDS